MPELGFEGADRIHDFLFVYEKRQLESGLPTLGVTRGGQSPGIGMMMRQNRSFISSFLKFVMPDAEPVRRTELPRVPVPLPRFQLSLARLMIVVTIVAVALALAVTLGGLLTSVFEALVWCVLPTPLIICAIYARGDLQAFAIGALVPWLTMLTVHVPAGSMFLPATIWLLVLGVICGMVAAATRRWVVR